MSDVQIHNTDKPDVILNSDRQQEAASLVQTANSNGIKDGLAGNLAQKSLDMLSDGEGKDAASQMTKNATINSFVTADNIKKNNQKFKDAKDIHNDWYKANKNKLKGRKPMDAAQGAAKNTAAYKGNLAALNRNRKLGNVKSVGATVGGFLSSALGESDEMQEVDSLYGRSRGVAKGVNRLRAFRARRAGKSAAAAKKTAEAAAKSARAARVAKAGAAAKTGGAAGGAAAGGPLLLILLIIAGIIFLAAIMNGILAAVLAGNHGELEGDQALIAQTLSEKGYNNAQIAAIMSNMYKESGYRSRVFQADGCEYDNLSIQQMAMAGGYGLCQWDGGRKPSLCIYCQTRGKAHGDVEGQCWWLDEELRYGGEYSYGKADSYEGYYYWSFDQWMNTPSDRGNVAGLSQTFTWQFERCDAGCYASRWPSQLEEAYRIFDALEGGMLDVVGRARAEIGKPYVWGAAGPDGYDCSGLVSYALTGQHAHLWTTYDFMTWPRTDNPLPGDICTTSEHCGIYIGNGQMIHAPQTGDYVKISNVQAGMIFVKKPG